MCQNREAPQDEERVESQWLERHEDELDALAGLEVWLSQRKSKRMSQDSVAQPVNHVHTIEQTAAHIPREGT